MTRTLGFAAMMVAVGLLAGCGSEPQSSRTGTVDTQAAQAAAVDALEAAAAVVANAVAENAPAAEVPAPIDLPQFAGRENLMKAMGGAARRVGSANADDARAAAVAIGEYSLAARHPRFEPEGPEYDAFAIDLWRKNQVVQAALSPEGDASSLQQALRAQRDACQACHTAYRIEED